MCKNPLFTNMPPEHGLQRLIRIPHDKEKEFYERRERHVKARDAYRLESETFLEFLKAIEKGGE